MVLIFWVVYILMFVSYFANNHMGNQPLLWAGLPWVFVVIEIGILGYKTFGFNFH